MKRLVIPDSEKEKGIVWVVYPVCNAQPLLRFEINTYKIECEVELKIQQEWN